MWLVALMVNSSILEEMTLIWRHICIVLSSPTRYNHFTISLCTLSKMADEMNQDPDKTNYVLQHVSVTSKGQINSTLVDDEKNAAVSLSRRFI